MEGRTLIECMWKRARAARGVPLSSVHYFIIESEGQRNLSAMATQFRTITIKKVRLMTHLHGFDTGMRCYLTCSIYLYAHTNILHGKNRYVCVVKMSVYM